MSYIIILCKYINITYYNKKIIKKKIMITFIDALKNIVYNNYNS